MRNDDRRDGLVVERGVSVGAHRREEKPVEEALDASGRMRVVDRRAEDESVRILCLRRKVVYAIVLKYAVFQLGALAAGNAVRYRLATYRDDLRLHAFGGEYFGHFIETGLSRAILVPRAVEHKNFHFTVPFLSFCLSFCLTPSSQSPRGLVPSLRTLRTLRETLLACNPLVGEILERLDVGLDGRAAERLGREDL